MAWRTSLRTKAAVLFTVMTLLPVIAAVVLLIEISRRPVQTAEEMLQSAMVAEVEGAAARLVRDVESDARVAAALFASAADGVTRDEDAITQVRALLGTRALTAAVRLEVPAAGIHTVIRKAGATVEPPGSTPALRAEADEQEATFGLTGPGQGVVVVRVPARGADRPAGYVVAAVPLDMLVEDLRGIVARRFGEQGGSLVVAAEDRTAVVAVGAAGITQGSDVARLPMFGTLGTDVAWNKSVAAVSQYEIDGRAVVGAIQIIPDFRWAVLIWRPRAEAFAAILDMQRGGLAVALVGAVLAIIVGVSVGRRLTRPILDLVTQARLIGERRWRELGLGASAEASAPEGSGAESNAKDAAEQVMSAPSGTETPARALADMGTSRRNDELGELATAIGRMAHDLEAGEAEISRQARLRGDLGRFMDRAIVEAIVRGEHPLSLGGQRATVTVLFADVVGFTPLAEAGNAERIVGLLNELFSMLTEIVFRHGGTVDKFIGDCIMAVWGAPVPQEDHAARALAAAEDMMRFLEAANDDWRQRYDVEIRLGIGINSGEAIAGNIGSDKRMEYTVIGDVVNVAARLESIATPNQVLVAEATRDYAKDAFPLSYLGEESLTGRKGKTRVYALDAG
ncbi:adenylate/guanylate cyclase domain-containing protein [Chondromyces crocatus]|uniref:Adenylate/guanylate cyclase n=1 Tax=Chondromyces crocatus TaxID=52 RepID=A0A0K1ETF4_CHOCO|nr:adenylate/guanylate cyclase domain-containing protein [Chondromyces crocatus]AKT43918.1 adenylate/guanylate cyclase [Chondromyces crocatus]